MIKRKVKKKEKNQCRHTVQDFNRIILSLVVFLFAFIHFCNSQQNGYSWLYDSQKRLLADTTIKMDNSISRINTNEKNLSYYLGNRILIINKINPTSKMVETGESLSFILKIDLKKIEFSRYEIIDICLSDTSVEMNLEILKNIKKELLGTILFNVCSKDYFYLHIPIKFIFKRVDSIDEIGVYKTIDKGWFNIIIKDNPVINY